MKITSGAIALVSVVVLILAIFGARIISGSHELPGIITPSATTSLDLSGSGLTKIPDYVFKLKDLSTLNLSGNRLTAALPGEIRQLSALRVLDASNNQMTGVPAEIGQLSNLEELNLSNNQLTGLPSELGNLTKLKTLNLSGNQVSKMDLDDIRAKLTGTNIIE